MANIFINLEQNPGVIIGWTASISTARAPRNSRTQVAIGESVPHPTKEAAWATISEKVEEIDYENNVVKFNNIVVESFEEVLQRVDEL